MAIDTRLLTVIKSINQLGICSVVDLNRATGISRPAIHRMVENLCAHGYTERVNGSGTIRLTSQILALSAGFKPENRLAEVAAPIFRDLETRVRWPLTLATRQDDMMVIQETTRDRNPFVFDNGRIGLSLPIVTTAIGCAYLAFCDEEELRLCLAAWQAVNAGQENVDEMLMAAQHRIARAKENGYALRSGGKPERTTTIAVPVVICSTIVGALCITFPTSAVPLVDAVGSFVPELQRAARTIGGKFEH